MRKLLIAGLAVALLTGVAYAQVNAPSDSDIVAMQQKLREFAAKGPTTCVDPAGVTRTLDETTTIGKFQFRCVETFGERLKSNGANWILVGAPEGMRIHIF
jgi:hypothetical protein